MIKTPFALIAFFAVALVASTLGGNVEARAGPQPVPTPPPPTATATVNPTPTLTPTSTPYPTSTPTPTPIPTPTMSPGVEVTARLKVNRCMLYAKIPVRWIEMEKAPKDDFHNLTLDDVPLIMAIMVAESGCDPHAVSSDGHGSTGLMQVIPRPWYADVSGNGMNVYVGMYIFDRSLDLSDGDKRLALAYYNCGVPKVEADACGTKGGVHYADKVLNFWLPLIEEKMEAQ